LKIFARVYISMKTVNKLFKAVRDLGPSKLSLYGQYQVGLRSGHYRRVLPSRRDDYDGQPGLPPYAHFPQVSQAQRDLVLAEADEIRRGSVRLFGGDVVPLNLNAGASSQHWTVLEKALPEGDIKLIWEPARFGWAITLARAYAFSGDPLYVRDFWDKTLHFLSAHPPNLGRHWQSAQEVAIRLMVLIFCDRVLAAAPSSLRENRRRLWQAVAEHATRIPPTLCYARAQNNNHLLSEAAGLYAAGLYLPSHPQAKGWRQLGWHWLNRGFQGQIIEFGTYVQHSVNYHRLMLQLAVFTDHLRRESGAGDWPGATQARLAEATRWLWALTDPDTGKTPNLGANDGAYVFPLVCLPITDYRPVVSAAARAFLGGEIYDQSGLQEMGDWFNLPTGGMPSTLQPQAPDMLRLSSGSGRAFLRAAQFFDRPSHADQLHVDLWWHGVNLAPDPGTYQYNAPPPWDNALAGTAVHNTLTVDGQQQMTRAGRFLWLDWAQAEVLGHEVDQEGRLAWITAEHDGYRRLGARHQRKLSMLEDGWLVADRILPFGQPDQRIHQVQLTWLLPDWDWCFDAEDTLGLAGPKFGLKLKISGVDQLSLVRAGETLHGSITAEPTWGWQSPTYLVKEPALMLIGVISGRLPIEMTSTWRIFEPSP
jgi:hypothetical protein